MNAAHKVIPMTPRSPQLEDGHIRIANELYDAVLLYPFTARQLKVVMAIMRKTYGYNKKVDDLSAAQIAAASGLHRSHVTATLASLASLNVITKSSGVYGSIVGINKNFTSWIGWEEVEDRLHRKPRHAELEQDDGAETAHDGCTELVHERCTESVQGVPNWYQTCTKTVQVDGTKTVHTKYNLPKDNLQKTKETVAAIAGDVSTAQVAARKQRRVVAMTAEQLARFERFYSAYPRKTHRKEAEKAFATLNPDDVLLAEMLDALRRERAAGKHADRKYIPHPASWLNGRRWLDEIQSEYTSLQREVIDAYNAALGDSLGHMDAAVFSESRAGRIDDFMTLSDKEQFWERYFPYVRDNCELPPGVGFDYLISREGFTKVKGGQHERRS